MSQASLRCLVCAQPATLRMRVQVFGHEGIIYFCSQHLDPNLRNAILKRVSYSSIDYESKPTTSVKGKLACGIPLPYQSSSMRPIPQLSNYKIPSLPNIYLCGSGNHPGAGVSMAPGRNASQVILADLGLDFNQIIYS